MEENIIQMLVGQRQQNNSLDPNTIKQMVKVGDDVMFLVKILAATIMMEPNQWVVSGYPVESIYCFFNCDFGLPKLRDDQLHRDISIGAISSCFTDLGLLDSLRLIISIAEERIDVHKGVGIDPSEYKSMAKNHYELSRAVYIDLKKICEFLRAFADKHADQSLSFFEMMTQPDSFYGNEFDNLWRPF